MWRMIAGADPRSDRAACALQAISAVMLFTALTGSDLQAQASPISPACIADRIVPFTALCERAACAVASVGIGSTTVVSSDVQPSSPTAPPRFTPRVRLRNRFDLFPRAVSVCG